jgi:hypothetical protein
MRPSQRVRFAAQRRRGSLFSDFSECAELTGLDLDPTFLAGGGGLQTGHFPQRGDVPGGGAGHRAFGASGKTAADDVFNVFLRD